MRLPWLLYSQLNFTGWTGIFVSIVIIKELILMREPVLWGRHLIAYPLQQDGDAWLHIWMRGCGV